MTVLNYLQHGAYLMINTPKYKLPKKNDEELCINCKKKTRCYYGPNAIGVLGCTGYKPKRKRK